MNDYLRNVSVLIADDREFNCQLLKQMLRVLGAQSIYTHTNSADAWATFKSTPIDLILLDWRMQPFSGNKLTKMIRNSPGSPNTYVPIIMVSAFGEKENVFAARDSGVTEYIIKPVSPKSLFSRIEAVISRPRRFVRVGEFFGPDRRRHKGSFTGEERRGTGVAAPAQTNGQTNGQANDQTKADTPKRYMSQDEVNLAFNPDEMPDGDAKE